MVTSAAGARDDEGDEEDVEGVRGEPVPGVHVHRELVLGAAAAAIVVLNAVAAAAAVAVVVEVVDEEQALAPAHAHLLQPPAVVAVLPGPGQHPPAAAAAAAAVQSLLQHQLAVELHQAAARALRAEVRLASYVFVRLLFISFFSKNMSIGGLMSKRDRVQGRLEKKRDTFFETGVSVPYVLEEVYCVSTLPIFPPLRTMFFPQ